MDKIVRKFLPLILLALALVGVPAALSFLSNFSWQSEIVWTYVEFGSWPQTRAAEGVEIDQSEPLAVGAFLYCKGSDGALYAKLGQDWFKVEPITWRVLSDKKGSRLLLAEKILACGSYYDVAGGNRSAVGATIYSNNYKHSRVRAWLNETFLQTAFTAEEKERIQLSAVDNSERSTNPDTKSVLWNGGKNKYFCEDTSDKVFLFSEREATKSAFGFGVYDSYGAGSARIRMPTDFAKAQGARQDPTGRYGGWWWLRSPSYSFDDSARGVTDFGYACDLDKVSATGGGIVPAIRLKP
ncbi:MAG: hypothetical protein J6V90_08880 [Treponema sp.]|nr:hypothetical protein [Treponema sp.]